MSLPGQCPLPDRKADDPKDCRTLGVDDTLPTALMRNFEKAIESGYREKEISALFEVLLPKSG